MESALGWLGDIFRALLKVIPQIILVRSTHAGVKFQWGSRVVELRPDNGIRKTGIHLFWPVVTEYEVVPVRRQTKDLQPQYLTTKDQKTVGVCGILVYEINDVVKLLTECFDYEDTIRDLSMAAVKEVIVQHNFDHLRDNGELIDAELCKTLRRQLNRFGVKTIRVTLSDFSLCQVVALWGAEGIGS
jgi:regulator of protease activity HflC (stomatin/prohibitin superfamily)